MMMSILLHGLLSLEANREGAPELLWWAVYVIGAAYVQVLG